MSLAKGYALETGQVGNVKRKSKAIITVINLKYACTIVKIIVFLVGISIIVLS